MGERILIVGGGGIGGVIASNLVEQGHRVSLAVRRKEIAQRISEHGLVLRDEHGQRTIRGELEVLLDPPEGGEFDFVLLTTQPNQVEEAARATAGLLGAHGVMVCFQNGLCEERVAQVVGEDRVLGAVVSWGASTHGPGSYERTSAGGFMLGRLSGAEDERIGRLALLLESVGPVDTTSNLRGARWSKLAMNAAISSLGTIGGERVGRLLVHRFIRRLALEVMTEAVEVAAAEGVTLEKVSGTVDLHWISLNSAERQSPGSPSLVAKHSLLLAVGARYRKLRSSMLAAIERGREPPIDFLNGEVVEHGKRRGVPTPVNAAVVDLVRAIANKQETSSLETLKRLYAATRQT
ncbi:MAG: 2-dehydropantoate 2-reductase [Myxococcota bacterium]|nr:2-dehydropantoate 2-reductase [Myxococcota bacterium]